MTLVDWQIQWHCGDRSYEPQWWNLKALAHKWLIPCPKNPMIAPYNRSQVNAASYDLRLGDKLKIAKVVEFTMTINNTRSRQALHFSAE